MSRGIIAFSLLVFFSTGCAASSASAPSTTRSASLGCADLPGELARGESLSSPLRVLAVRELREQLGRQLGGAPRGVEVRVRAAHGMDDVAVRRTVLCRASAATSATDPLAVSGARARIDRRGLDYVVTVTSSDRQAAREIATRASALAPR